MKTITRFLHLFLALTLFAQPAQAAYNPNNANGQTTAANSAPVTLSAPAMITSSTFTRPANTTQYTAGALFGNSTTAGSVVPLSWAIAPANGVPIYALKALLQTQTSGAAGVTITNGSFRLHLYSTSPTIASGDGVAFSTTMAGYCGALDGTLSYQGTDWSVAELVPVAGFSVMCKPAGGSSTLYGLLEIRAAFTPTNGQVTQVTLVAQ